MNSLKIFLLLMFFTTSITCTSQKKIDSTLMGEWKLNIKKDTAQLVRNFEKPGLHDQFLVLNITEKGASLEFRTGGLICASAGYTDSTSCSINDNKISIYNRVKYLVEKKSSETKVLYEIISMEKDVIKLKELERKKEYF